MPVYMIGQITITDRESYDKYQAGFMEVFQQFEGTLLSIDESPTVVEGKFEATRSVLIRFPNEAAAKAWYDSDAYQALAQHRYAASTANTIIVKGFDFS